MLLGCRGRLSSRRLAEKYELGLWWRELDMKKLAILLVLCLVTGGWVRSQGGHEPPARAGAARVLPWQRGLPIYDHVVIVVEENRDYDEIIGHADAPYINGVLKAEGANFTRMFAEEHYSQGNY